ncbi:hypothetical protein TNCV_4012931 [Trichonephila clavipes]|nr:hypothetical protein TNCV_4012931 [Trichonephila clavipes]
MPGIKMTDLQCCNGEYLPPHLQIPPREVNIVDESGQRIEETIGPVDEGSNVTLICEAEGDSTNPKSPAFVPELFSKYMIAYSIN